MPPGPSSSSVGKQRSGPRAAKAILQEVLRRWSKAMPNGGFVITSNVDGQFQSSGFGEEVIVEGHGSMAYLQCVEPCNDAIWSASELVFEGEQLTELPRWRDVCEGFFRRPLS